MPLPPKMRRMREPLIETGELARRIDDPSVAVIDCRFDLANPAWGETAYAQSHIPGAVYAHLDRDLSSPVTRMSGRHPLPDRMRLAQTLSQWGIDAGVDVVVYDQNSGAFAARAWWLLRWLGHARVALLNGGLAAWEASGLPVRGGVESRAPRSFTPGEPLEAALETVQVRQRLDAAAIQLVDARAPERFLGRSEPIDSVAGHIPGAQNHPLSDNLDANGKFPPPEELRRRWLRTLNGRDPALLVSMCGSGVTACHNLVALRAAGLAGGRLYAGSWSEWIRDPSRPVVLSSAP